MERDHSMTLSRSGSLRSSSRTTLIRRNQSMSAKQIRFYRNGDRFFNGLKLAVSPERYKELDALLAELSTKLDLSSGAVRFIFNGEDGSMITDISQLHYGVPYVCSSTNTFKQLDVGYGKTAPQWALAQRNSRSTNTLTGLENLATPAKDAGSGGSRDFIKPKLVTVIRNGKPPQKKVTMLLNNKTAISLDQVLDHLSAKGSLGKVDKLYSVDRKLVKDLRDLFDDDTVFIAFASTEKFPEEGVELDPNSSKHWLSTSVIRHEYPAALRPDVIEQRQVPNVEDGKENRPSAELKLVTRTISLKPKGNSDNEKIKTRSNQKGSITSNEDQVLPSRPLSRCKSPITSPSNMVRRRERNRSEEVQQKRDRATTADKSARKHFSLAPADNYPKRSASAPPGMSQGKKHKDHARRDLPTVTKTTGLARSPIRAAKQAFQGSNTGAKGGREMQRRKMSHSRSSKQLHQKRKGSSDRGSDAGGNVGARHGYFVYVHEELQGFGRARPTAFVKPSVPSKEQRSNSLEGKPDKGGKYPMTFKDNKTKPARSAENGNDFDAEETGLNSNRAGLGVEPSRMNSGTMKLERPNKLAFQKKVEVQLSNLGIQESSKSFLAFSSDSDTDGQTPMTSFVPTGGSSPVQLVECSNDSGVGLHEPGAEEKSLALEFASIGEPVDSISYPLRNYIGDDDEGGDDVKGDSSQFSEATSTDSGITDPESKSVVVDGRKSYVVVTVKSPEEDKETTGVCSAAGEAISLPENEESVYVSMFNAETESKEHGTRDCQLSID